MMMKYFEGIYGSCLGFKDLIGLECYQLLKGMKFQILSKKSDLESIIKLDFISINYFDIL